MRVLQDKGSRIVASTRPHLWAAPAVIAAALLLAGSFPDVRAPLVLAAVAVPVMAAIVSIGSWWYSRAVMPDRARAGWILVGLAAGFVAFASADGLLGKVPGDASDLATAMGWLFAAAGILVLIGGRVDGRSVDGVIEGLLVAAPLAYLGIAFLLDARPGPVSFAAGLVGIVTVAAHVVLVALAGQLWRVQRGSLTTPSLLALGGTVSLLAAHVVDVSALLAGGDRSGVLGEAPSALFLLTAVAWIGAAAHPEARHHIDRTETMPTPLTRVRLAIVLLSVVIGPLVLAIRVTTSRPQGVEALTAGAVVVAGVAIAHLARLVEQRSVVEYLALHDDLTGLPNRVLLGDRISSALGQALRHDRRTALLFLDLDRFKTINDSLGHAAGNELLRAVAGRLSENVGPEDTVARMGGDEFALLLPSIDGPADACEVARTVLASFRSPFEVAGRQLFVSPSIGVSLHPDDAADGEELLRNADAAMYQSKAKGRNTFEVYTGELNVRARQRLTLETSLHKAIERDELVLHYQPKVELRTGAIVGMEALVRWEHPSLGLVLPGEFIPAAEETGLIVPLGEWALDEACRQTKEWTDAGHSALTVSVNLSPRQFQHLEVGDMVARVLRSTGLDPRALELELTESLALQDPDAITATLRDLRDMGVQCSIDDFGTGYSGLHYLTRFPIDKLKIDRFFVNEISSGGGNARIVAAVIALAHGLRLGVIAEGVETDEQLRFLLDNGCDEMQGFLFSEPIPAAAFEELLTGSATLAGRVPLERRLRVVDGQVERAALPEPAVAVRVHGQVQLEGLRRQATTLLADPGARGADR
jgi:diguanylate cyclase (GGDEF)-like protein